MGRQAFTPHIGGGHRNRILIENIQQQIFFLISDKTIRESETNFLQPFHESKKMKTASLLLANTS